MSADVVIPRETANDDVVKIVRWLVSNGDDVRAGSPILEVETSKSVIDIEAPCSGRLVIIRNPGDEVPVGGSAGRIEGIERTSISPTLPSASDLPSNDPSVTEPRISAKARAKMLELGVDDSAVAHLTLVRESDVEGIVKNHDLPRKTSPLASGSVSTPTNTRGGFGAVRQAATERGRSVLWLAFNYAWRNWFLGNLARVSPVGVIRIVHRLRGVKMGRDCFIDPNAILETAYPENITLGDDVRVTAGAIIMTHIKGPYLLRDRGYVPMVLKPVHVKSHSFIGVNAIIMPGVTIGEGAVVTSGSVVTNDVAPYTMVTGNPAKVVKTFQ